MKKWCIIKLSTNEINMENQRRHSSNSAANFMHIVQCHEFNLKFMNILKNTNEYCIKTIFILD